MRPTSMWWAVALLAVPFGAIAGGASDASGTADQPDAERRDVVVRVTPTEAVIELVDEGNESQDRITVRYTTEDALLSIAYENEAADIRYEKRMDVQLHQLVEYVDSDADGHLDVDEPVKSSWLLSSESRREIDSPPNGTLLWQPLTSQDVRSADDEGVLVMARAGFPAEPGLLPPIPMPMGNEPSFGLDLAAFGDFATWGSKPLGPTDVKADVLVRNYPYAAQGTGLALILETASEDSLEASHAHIGPGEDGLASTAVLGDRAVGLVWRWDTDALVDEEQEPVRSSTYRSEMAQRQDPFESVLVLRKVYSFEYAGGTNVTHDPVIGASIDALPAGGVGGGDDGLGGAARSVTGILLGVVVAAIVVAGVLFLASRMRGRRPAGR